jgi:ABC-type amino acid transport substrate-binding protein
VGPLARDVFYLVALQDSKVNPTSNLKELRKLKTSGIAGDQPVQFLEKLGFKVTLIDDDKERYARIRAGTLDLDIMSEISQPAYEKMYDLKFKRIYRMYKQDYFIAFNPNTPAEFIDKLNRELRKIRKSDLYKKLHDEYIPTTTTFK